MGANIAKEVANGDFCEATLGTQDLNRGFLLRSLIGKPQFRIQISRDKSGIEICGAAKNALAIGVGLLRGIGEGHCAVALLIKLGMIEILKLLKSLSTTSDASTIIESCGFADIIASCDAGRNARVAKMYAQLSEAAFSQENAGPVSWEVLERDLLHGQKLQGVMTAAMIYEHIAAHKNEKEYPLFTQIHYVATNQARPTSLVDVLRVS